MERFAKKKSQSSFERDVGCPTQKNQHGHKKILFGNDENLIENGGLLLEERVSLFYGKTNPIRCFSVGELNTMISEVNCELWIEFKWYNGVMDGRKVLIRESRDDLPFSSREIAIATQMSAHTNVHKLLGYCLETKHPILVYETVGNGCLHKRIIRNEIQNKPPLEWKSRLRIACEISHAVAYLHYAFPRPIVHRDLKPANVLLNQDDVAKLTAFTLSFSIPEGKTHVENEPLIGTFGYIAPECLEHMRLAEKADVYSFGVLFLVILTGLHLCTLTNVYSNEWSDSTNNWVRKVLMEERVSEIVDPAIVGNRVTGKEILQQQLRASLELVLKCTEYEEDSRPTMVEVATQLKNILMSEIEC